MRLVVLLLLQHGVGIAYREVKNQQLSEKQISGRPGGASLVTHSLDLLPCNGEIHYTLRIK